MRRIRLGSLVSSFAGRPVGWQDFVFWLLPGAALALTLAYFGYAQFTQAVIETGPALALPRARWLFLASLSSALLLLLIALARLRQAHRRVDLFDNGLRIRLGKTTVLPWSYVAGIRYQAIESAWLFLPLGRQEHAWLLPTAGAPIRLFGLQRMGELVEQVKQQIYPRALPELEAGLRQGRSAHFGPLTLNTAGVTIAGQRIPLEAIQLAEFSAGQFTLQAGGAPAVRLPASDIPNPELLLSLLRQFLPQHGVESS